MLMDLQKLRNFGWSTVWRRIATEQLKLFGAVQLADQVSIVTYQKVYFRLGCDQCCNRTTFRTRLSTSMRMESTDGISIATIFVSCKGYRLEGIPIIYFV